MYLSYSGIGQKVDPRLRDCCRQGQSEVVSNNRNKVHQTWGPPYSRALYRILGSVQLLLNDLETDRHVELPALVLVVVAQLHLTLVVHLELVVRDDKHSSHFIDARDVAVEDVAGIDIIGGEPHLHPVLLGQVSPAEDLCAAPPVFLFIPVVDDEPEPWVQFNRHFEFGAQNWAMVCDNFSKLRHVSTHLQS